MMAFRFSLHDDPGDLASVVNWPYPWFGGSMTQQIEAIYTDGVLKPAGELGLRDQQRVRLTVETIDEPVIDREAAVARLKAGIASMGFFSGVSLPSREELHDRR